jgi:hypothetical protein
MVALRGHRGCPSVIGSGRFAPAHCRRHHRRVINRYYDPASYQFISVDPKVGMTLQPYTFVGGDPLNESDPLGLYRWDRYTHHRKVAQRPARQGRRNRVIGASPYHYLGAPSARYSRSISIPEAYATETITASVTISGPKANDHVTVSTDGTVDVSVNSVDASFSPSEGADASASVGGFGASSQGLSYTSNQTRDVGPDSVTTETTMTIGPGTPSGLSPTARGVVAITGTVVGGAAAGIKALSGLCSGPYGGFCEG